MKNECVSHGLHAGIVTRETVTAGKKYQLLNRLQPVGWTDANHGTRGVMDHGVSLRKGKPCCRCNGLFNVQGFRSTQRPWRMINIGINKPPSADRVKPKPGGQESLEVTRPDRVPELHLNLGSRQTVRPSAPTAICQMLVFDSHAHLRPGIRQTVAEPRRNGSKQTRTVQREEPDRWLAIGACHVSTAIGLEKSGNPRQGRQERRAKSLQQKRSNSHPGRSVENVNRQPRRNTG